MTARLRDDLRQVMSDKMDSLVINGQAAVADTSPAVAGVISSLDDPTNPTDTATALDYLTTYTAVVDGKHASGSDGVRMLVNVDTYRHAHGLQIPTSGELLADRLPSERFRASANMPDTPSTGNSANIATALTYTGSSPARGLIVPTWRGVGLIVDPYTLAKKRQRIITATTYVGFVMADSAPYRRVEFKIA